VPADDRRRFPAAALEGAAGSVAPVTHGGEAVAEQSTRHRSRLALAADGSARGGPWTGGRGDDGMGLFAPGDLVELREGGVCVIAAREQVREKGKVVPVYEALTFRAGRTRGPVRLIGDAGIAGRHAPAPDPREALLPPVPKLGSAGASLSR
jgi:hypothetical protein